MSAPFDGFLHDAALFPPGDAPMSDAVPGHRELRERWGGLVGPLVVPAARLPELVGHLSATDRVAVSVIAPAAELPGVVDAATAAAAVAVFTSFGTCDVDGPIEDLLALVLLPTPGRLPA